MLVLTRKLNQAIMIGDDVKIVIVAIDRDQVRIGIEAPRSVSVHRAEIYEEIARAAAQAAEGKTGT
jgi:carbon storage regulator